MDKMQDRLLTCLRAACPGCSASELARRVGLSRGRYHNYEAGQRSMDDDAVIGIATYLGWDIEATLAAHKAETAATERVRRFYRARSKSPHRIGQDRGVRVAARATALKAG